MPQGPKKNERVTPDLMSRNRDKLRKDGLCPPSEAEKKKRKE